MYGKSRDDNNNIDDYFGNDDNNDEDEDDIIVVIIVDNYEVLENLKVFCFMLCYINIIFKVWF